METYTLKVDINKCLCCSVSCVASSKFLLSTVQLPALSIFVETCFNIFHAITSAMLLCDVPPHLSNCMIKHVQYTTGTVRQESWYGAWRCKTVIHLRRWWRGTRQRTCWNSDNEMLAVLNRNINVLGLFQSVPLKINVYLLSV
jgi:hypothetical protein